MFIVHSRLLLVLGLIGAAVGIFFGVKGALLAHDAVSEVNRKGGDENSLFHAAKFDSALDKVRANVGADGDLLRLIAYPGYMTVEASTGSEDEGRAFKVQESGRVTKMPLTLTGPGRLADNVFPLAKLHGSTIEKLAGEVAAKENGTLDDVAYVIAQIQPGSGDAGLSVYMKNSRFWQAALDGSGLVNPDKQARKSLDDAEATIESATKSATKASGGTAKQGDDLAACVQAAGTDVAKLQACSS
jgi:hypothetical protein